MSLSFGLKALGALGTAVVGGLAGVAGESMGLTDRVIAVVEDATNSAGLGGQINAETAQFLAGEWCKPQNTSSRMMKIEGDYLKVATCNDGECAPEDFRPAWVKGEGGMLHYRLAGETDWVAVWRKDGSDAEVYFDSGAPLAGQTGWTRCELVSAPEPEQGVETELEMEPNAGVLPDMVFASDGPAELDNRLAFRESLAAVAAADAVGDVEDETFRVVIRASGGRVNIRLEPTTNSPRLGYAENGDVLVAHEEVASPDDGDKWYAITTHSGRAAFIHGDYVEPMSEAQLSRFANRAGE